MPYPQGATLHVNVPLTQISIAWQNGNRNRFVAGTAFPTINVRHQGNLYWKYRREDWLRGQAELRAPATESAGSGWTMDQDSYFCNVYALHKDLDDQTVANADAPFNLDRESTTFVTENLLTKRETDWTGTFMDAGVWGTDRTGVASGATGLQFNQWDTAGSDPIADVNQEIVRMAEVTGFRPNTLVLGPYVWEALTRNASILERIKYTGNGGWINEAVLAQALNVNRILVTWGIQNTANFGETEATSFMGTGAGKDAMLCYSAPRAGLRTPSAGYIFAWSGLLGSGAYTTRVKKWRMEEIASDRIEAEMAYDMKVVAPELGVFWDGAVA